MGRIGNNEFSFDPEDQPSMYSAYHGWIQDRYNNVRKRIDQMSDTVRADRDTVESVLERYLSQEYGLVNWERRWMLKDMLDLIEEYWKDPRHFTIIKEK